MVKAWLTIALMTSAIFAAPDDAEIRALLANRIDEGKKAVGIVVGTIDEKGRHVIGHGRVAQGREQQPDGDTVFEIGSISKVFTSLLLADMIERGEVKPNDPVAKYLPSTVTVPSRNGRQITLLDLSMQVSGLPRLPNNMKPADLANPYADYDAAKLYAFLSGYTLTRDPGEKYEYSNLAVGLLGHALALKAGMSYEQLVRRRILEPLGMTSTSITLSESEKARLAPGYNDVLKPVKNWDLDALAGAGALRSTANDMLKFLAANLELTDSPLKAAMRRMRSVHHDTGIPDLEIMMAWHVLHKYGTELVWHNGGTAGYRSFAGFVPAEKKGVVVLCNTSFDIDEIGRHVLESRYEVGKFSAPKERKEIALPVEVFDHYLGEYELAPNVTIKVTRDGKRMLAQVSGQAPIELFAESETDFFLRAVDAQIQFVKDDSGAVTKLILHQGGQNMEARRRAP
ncbi:MAG TPA: serine hydrolase [Bryobacteraceae bacterium]|nr:serine hydrolase [Bryobacteraceae bacterium]